jgi:hypothetical protein
MASSRVPLKADFVVLLKLDSVVALWVSAPVGLRGDPWLIMGSLVLLTDDLMVPLTADLVALLMANLVVLLTGNQMVLLEVDSIGQDQGWAEVEVGCVLVDKRNLERCEVATIDLRVVREAMASKVGMECWSVL